MNKEYKLQCAIFLDFVKNKFPIYITTWANISKKININFLYIFK